MKLQKAPILHLFKLEVDPKNHDKLIQSMLDAHLDQNALFMQSGHEDEAGHKNYAVNVSKMIHNIKNV